MCLLENYTVRQYEKCKIKDLTALIQSITHYTLYNVYIINRKNMLFPIIRLYGTDKIAVLNLK